MTQRKERTMCKLYKKAYDKVHGKLYKKYASKSEMEVLLTEFYDLKSIIMERLLLIKTIQNDVSSSLTTTACYDDSNKLHNLDYKEMIHAHMLSAMDEWNVMNHLYNREASQRRKKSSKISRDYLEVHHVLLLHIRDYIYEINDEDLTDIPNNLGAGNSKYKTENILTPKRNNLTASLSPHHDDQNNDHPANCTLLKKDKTPVTSQHKGRNVTETATMKENDNLKQLNEKIKAMEKEIDDLKAIVIEKTKLANTQDNDNDCNIANKIDDTNGTQVSDNRNIPLLWSSLLSSLSNELQPTTTTSTTNPKQLIDSNNNHNYKLINTILQQNDENKKNINANTKLLATAAKNNNNDDAVTTASDETEPTNNICKEKYHHKFYFRCGYLKDNHRCINKEDNINVDKYQRATLKPKNESSRRLRAITQRRSNYDKRSTNFSSINSHNNQSYKKQQNMINNASSYSEHLISTNTSSNTNANATYLIDNPESLKEIKGDNDYNTNSKWRHDSSSTDAIA